VFHDCGLYPDGFRQDAAKADDDPFDDNPKSSEYNAPDMAAMFVNSMLALAERTPNTKNLIQPMGNYNFYENAQFNYMNMEKIVNYVQSHYKDLNMKIVFSTPSEYLAALEQEKLNFNVFTGDLISLDEGVDVFAGSYSSKPNLKKELKVASSE
jgi:hypothetical protein